MREVEAKLLKMNRPKEAECFEFITPLQYLENCFENEDLSELQICSNKYCSVLIIHGCISCREIRCGRRSIVILCLGFFFKEPHVAIFSLAYTIALLQEIYIFA